ncbi:MAG: hypothetical protein ABH869_03075, partial [Candidatus Omnitrophota bacterium]
KILKTLPSLILQKKIESRKARGMEITEEVAEQIKETSDYKFLKNVIASAIVIVDENTERVNVYLESEEVGRWMYSVKVMDAKEGEKEQLDIEVIKNVPQKAFEEAKFVQSLQDAKFAAERAITEGTSLSEKVQNQLISALQKKVEIYLQNIISTYGDKADLGEALDEETITALAGRIGIKKGDPIIEQFITHKKDLMIANARGEISSITKTQTDVIQPAVIEVSHLSADENAETGYSMKRLGTDEDTGEKARLFFTKEKKAEFEKLAEQIEEKETHGTRAKVITANLEDVSAGYQFTASDNKTTIIVLNDNPVFLKNVSGNANVTEKEIQEETIYHEAREAFWKSYKEAHRIACAEQTKRFGKEYKLTPYHHSELKRMTIQELLSLLKEDRSKHLDFFKNNSNPEIRDLAEFAEKYETLLQNEVKLEIFRRQCVHTEHYLSHLQENIDKLNAELSKISRSPSLRPKLEQRKDDLLKRIETAKNLLKEKTEQFNISARKIDVLAEEQDKTTIKKLDADLKTARLELNTFEKDFNDEISRDLEIEKVQKTVIPSLTTLIKQIKKSKDAVKTMYDETLNELLSKNTDPDRIKWLNIEFQYKCNHAKDMIKSVNEGISAEFPASKMQKERDKYKAQCNELLAEFENYEKSIKAAVNDAKLKEELNALVKEARSKAEEIRKKRADLSKKLHADGFKPNILEMKQELQKPIDAFGKDVAQIKDASNELLTSEVRDMFQTVINNLTMELNRFNNIDLESIYKRASLRQEITSRTENAQKAEKDAQKKLNEIKMKLAQAKLSPEKIAELSAELQEKISALT